MGKVWRIVFFLFFVLPNSAQNRYPFPADYLHNSWTTAQGLPQDTVYCLMQSQDGFLWIGTDSGLARFDGLHFFFYGKHNAPFLSSTTVTSLVQDHQGVIWIGTFGSGLLRLEKGNITRLDNRNELPSNHVWTLCQDAKEALWIGTIGAGLIRRRHGNTTVFSTENGLPSDNVKALCIDRRGTMWIGTERGLASYHQGVFKTYEPEEGIFGRHILSIMEDPSGRLWIGTTRGLYTMESGRFSLVTARGQVNPDTVRAMACLRDGSIWLATDEGLKILTPGAKEPMLSRVNDLLSDTSLMCLLSDSENGIWIGTSGRGVNRLEQSPIRTYTTKEGLSKNHILSLNQDGKGDFWVGTSGGGVNHQTGGRWLSYTSGQGKKIESVFAVEPDNEGNVWLGTGSGLFRFHDERFTSFSRIDGLSSDSIRALHEGSSGTLWIGTIGGLNMYRKGVITPFPPEGKPFGNDIASILEDRSGILWVGSTGHGLSRIQGSMWRSYTTADGLSSNDIQCLYKDGDGILFIGTSGGLSIRIGDTFHSISTQQGLFDNSINHILEDDEKNLWMSCRRGIFRVAKSTIKDLLEKKRSRIECLELGEAEGLHSTVCTGGFQPAGLKTRDGQLWFPTMNGVVAIMPQKIHSHAPVHPVILDEVSADGQVFLPDQPLTLPAGVHKIGFHFTLPYFHQPLRVSFRFRLEGFEKEWTQTGAERIATYPALKHGTYRFLVEALFRGEKLGQAVSPPVVIKPFFHETAWFYIIVALLVAGSQLFIYILRKRWLAAEKYRASTLEPWRAPHYQKKLLEMMNSEKPFLDPDLTVTMLATRLGMPAKHLSQLINDRFGQNFNEFVNRYRVEEAIRRFNDPSQRDSKLLKIAFESGFNSKSVFNEAFKKHTGKNPSQFRKECEP